MEQLHAHEVLHMMEGNSYTEATLRAAIVEKFGEHQRFYACSADNMEASPDANTPVMINSLWRPFKSELRFHSL